MLEEKRHGHGAVVAALTEAEDSDRPALTPAGTSASDARRTARRTKRTKKWNQDGFDSATMRMISGW